LHQISLSSESHNSRQGQWRLQYSRHQPHRGLSSPVDPPFLTSPPSPPPTYRQVTSATLSSDDRYLLTSSRFSPSRLIDLRTGNVVTKYTMRGYSGSTNWLYRSSFCANDQSVMGGTSPGVTAVWSTQSGELLYSLQIPSPSSASASTASASVSASSASSSYLKPSLPSIPPPSYPLTLPSEALFSSAQSHRSLVKQLRRAEVVQCASDRLSGLVATVTDSAVVLWK
jgi:WD40 repeat protein